MIIVVMTMIILAILLLTSKVYIHIHYVYSQADHHIYVKFRFLKITLFQREITLDGVAGDIHMDDILQFIESIIREREVGKKMKNIWKELQVLKEEMKLIIRTVVFQEFCWKTNIGVQDAMTTGIAAGALWAVKGTAVGLVYQPSPFKRNPEIAVYPSFQQQVFRTDFSCMVSVKLGQAIRVTNKLLKNATIKKHT